MRRRARVGWCPSGKQGAALVHGPEWRLCTSSPRSPCPSEAPWRVNRRGCLFPVTMWMYVCVCMCMCGRMRVSHLVKCCPLDGTQRPAVPCAANCVQVCSAYWSPFARSFQNQFSSENSDWEHPHFPSLQVRHAAHQTQSASTPRERLGPCRAMGCARSRSSRYFFSRPSPWASPSRTSSAPPVLPRRSSVARGRTLY